MQLLSEITGISESKIKEDIRDYKFFLDTYQAYKKLHPKFEVEIVDLKTDPFWRMFKAAFEFRGEKTSPTEILRITTADDFTTTSLLEGDLFARIVQLVFEAAIVTEKVNTRNVLADVEGNYWRKP